MKYREAICNGGGGGSVPCDWTHTALTDKDMETLIERHLAPTRVLNKAGLSWPHEVYVIDVYK